MNRNLHTYSNLYKSKLQVLLTVGNILSILIFICLTSIFLYGGYLILPTDASYTLVIIVLSLITLFKDKVTFSPYWYLRPKINQSLFSNLFNIFNLIFSGICIALILINFRDQEVTLSFGTFGSIIFMIGLPFSFYFWLVFKRVDLKSKIEISGGNLIKSYHPYEVYIHIILIAVFGIVYDFLPQTSFNLLIIPLGCIILLSILKFLINKLVHSNILRLLKSTDGINKNVLNEFETKNIYEFAPYTFIPKLRSLYEKADSSERTYLLYTLTNISAIDAIDILEDISDASISQDSDKNHLLETIQYLKEIQKQVGEIDNPYEFIEQSSNFPLIKGLIRSQIDGSDKNLLLKLLNDNRIEVKRPACIVAGYHDDINIISILIEQLENPEIGLWAQFALENIGDKAVKYLEIEFSKRKENLLFVEACFEILIKIPNDEPKQLIFISLNETNINIRKIAAKKIISHNIFIKDTNIKYFKKIFDELIISLVENTYLMEHIKMQNENFNALKNALENENKEMLYLTINIAKLYCHEHLINKIFENYAKLAPEDHAQSNMLIDLALKENLDILNKLKILFSPRDRQLVEGFQEEFPVVELRSNYINEEELVWDILKKEYIRINSYTRSCAINTLQYLFTDDIPFELAAEFLNENLLLKETAAANVYKNLPEFYTIFLKRLEPLEATKIDYIVRSNFDVINESAINEDNLLFFDKINFLQSIPYLKNLSTSEILNFEQYFKPKVLRSGQHQISLVNELNNGFWIVESGEVTFSKNGKDYFDFKRRDIIKISEYDNNSKYVYFNISTDARFLIVDEAILLNTIKNYKNLLFDYLLDTSTMQPNNEINEENNKAA